MPRGKTSKSKSKSKKISQYKMNKFNPGLHMGFPKGKVPYDNAYIVFYNQSPDKKSLKVLLSTSDGKPMFLGGKRFVDRLNESESEHNPVHTAIRNCYEQLFGKVSAGILYKHNPKMYNKHYDAIVHELFLEPKLVKECVKALKEFDLNGGFAGHYISHVAGGEISIVFYWPFSVLDQILLPMLNFLQHNLLLENFNFGGAEPIYESYYTEVYPNGLVPMNVLELMRNRFNKPGYVGLREADILAASVQLACEFCHVAHDSIEKLQDGLARRENEMVGIVYLPPLPQPVAQPSAPLFNYPMHDQLSLGKFGSVKSLEGYGKGPAADWAK
jgi:hypothetical protein